MCLPQAIGFDLFNTLISIDPVAMEQAHSSLILTLLEQEIPVEPVSFRQAYAEAAKGYILDARRDGRETHNRFWIAEALKSLGHPMSPDSPQVSAAVEAYFSAFYPNCQLIPGTDEMLTILSGRYPLGLLTNFTHPPAALKIIDMVGLSAFFRTVLISGEIGYRKPHPYVFNRLTDDLGVRSDEIVFVGDDPESDVQGALNCGIRAVLTTCVQDQNIRSAYTMLSPPGFECPSDVPRISCWQDLLTLLEAPLG